MAPETSASILQPCLLDRLVDSVPSATLFELSAKPEDLQRAGIEPPQIAAALSAFGLASTAVEGGPEVLSWRCSISGRNLAPADIGALRLKASDGNAILLEALCQIRARVVPIEQGAALQRRGISARKLRECVIRDLTWLLNTSNLESCADLEPFPAVARSVLNFGMPLFANNIRLAIERESVALQIKACITNFEPRLSSVTVTPETSGRDEDIFTLAFRIQAELWGEPVPQHLMMRTEIDVGTGDVMLDDHGG